MKTKKQKTKTKKPPQIFMSKSFYLCSPILELSKTVIYEFWYDYVKPKYSEKILCYMDTYGWFHCPYKNQTRCKRC